MKLSYFLSTQMRLRFTAIILHLLAGLTALPALQAQVKRLYIANDDHTDYMWTANEAQYDSAFVHMLDYYLDQIDATRSNPEDLQARFNCDGSYWLTVYEKYRTPEQFKRLERALHSGHISSPLTTLVSTYGAQPTEAVLRGMYAAGKLERRLGLRFRLAVAMENQTLPLGLSSLWAGSGARYSWKGVCGCASRITDNSLAHRRLQLYRYTGLDGSAVTMKWYNLGLNSGARTLGGYAETRKERAPTDIAGDIDKMLVKLDELCDTVSAQSAYPYNVAGAFGYGWDDLETYVSPAFIEAAKKNTSEVRKVRVSNEEDFFHDIERSHPTLPRESVTYGNEWDTYPASMNETTAKVRRATEKLRTAEALASVVSLKDKSFGRQLFPARNAAWEAYGLYWEHDWTADGPVAQKERAEWQIRVQEKITGYTDSLLHTGLNALGDQLKKAANPRFYVFNPLSWVRNDVADISYNGAYPVKVIDVATGKEVASQLVTKGDKRFIRILAENIPSVGYKVYEIRKGTPISLPKAASFSGKYFKNAFYQILLRKSGVITELYDMSANGRQLVKETDKKYLNDLGTANLDDGEPLVVENAGPVSVTLKAVSRRPVLHTVRLTLYKNTPRIDIEDSIRENYKDLKTWAFSFGLQNQTTRHEELGAIITAKKETRGGHYASQNARYDWQTFNHFADMSEPGYGITLSNQDCSFFKLGKSTPDSLWEYSAQLNALAGGQTDPYTLNPSGHKDTVMMGIYYQYGQKDFQYQFAITTHQSAFDPLAAMKFSLEHQNPLATGMVTGQATANAGTLFSLLTVNDPGVLLWAVKPSDEGIEDGLVTRFWNFRNKKVQPLISLQKNITHAWATSHLETVESALAPMNGKVNPSFEPHQIRTFKLQMK